MQMEVLRNALQQLLLRCTFLPIQTELVPSAQIERHDLSQVQTRILADQPFQVLDHKAHVPRVQVTKRKVVEAFHREGGFRIKTQRRGRQVFPQRAANGVGLDHT
jgi:hypothetical protein